MSGILPINIDDLLNGICVESSRIELKASWDDKTTGNQVIKTICAYANDIQNLNGGYIIIGVEEDHGRAVLPPKGLAPESIDHIQTWIRGHCNRIDPVYQPRISPETVSDKMILVIWAPGSDTRPHQAPDGENRSRKFYVRLGSNTVDAAANGVIEPLMQLTARVPYDDRRNMQATIDDIREGKVREFLNDIHSELVYDDDTIEVYRRMQISERVNSHDAPKNIGLLMFSENPEVWYRGARIEVVHYAADNTGDVLEEKIFRGAIHEQLRNALTYLESISSAHLEKQNNSMQVKGWVSYPVPALREALVNAVYHRGYESYEPIKVCLYPDRIDIYSYPGPVPGLNHSHLRQEAPMPLVPARNRRIGEFLKELRLAEGRGTGLPKIFRVMRDNGSQDPQFDFDEQRTYFRVTLPAHPEYVAISALRDAAHLNAIGNSEGAFNRVVNAWQALPSSPSLTVEYIKLLGQRDNITKAQSVFDQFKQTGSSEYHPYVINVLIEVMLNAGRNAEAEALLKSQQQHTSNTDALDAAILARRLDNQELAHKYFSQASSIIQSDPRAMHEFAQTKIMLAQKLHKRHRSHDENRRLLTEAKELLERVTHTNADPIRHAWAWRDLGRVRNWLRFPQHEVVEAYQHAITAMPNEPIFTDELSSYLNHLRIQ